MANGNTITVVGNITRDPEIRYTPGGTAKATFGVAVNRRWQDRASGEWQEQTSFFDVVCWGDMAEHVQESLEKGTRVVVTGRLEQRSWETDQGERRSKIEIVADDVGPSLRWAKATVSRTERRAPEPGRVAAAPAPVGGMGAELDDEEPF